MVPICDMSEAPPPATRVGTNGNSSTAADHDGQRDRAEPPRSCRPGDELHDDEHADREQRPGQERDQDGEGHPDTRPRSASVRREAPRRANADSMRS